MFPRSTRTQRSPPQKANDSTEVDPNATNCPLCRHKDTAEMVECEQCKNWFHFQCVGVDSSVASVSWKCQKCLTPVDPIDSNCPLCDKEDALLMLGCLKCKNLFHFPCANVDTSVDTSRWNCQECTSRLTSVERKSIRSSTSSKRRSVLLLEKLSKEKAIQDKLIEEKSKLAQQQATVDTEFLHKEYEILENMTDSEDGEMTGAGSTKGNEYVTDWLNSTNVVTPTQPDVVTKLLHDIRTMKEQIRDNVIGDMPNPLSSAETRAEDLHLIPLHLIPPKHVQFEHPLSNETDNDIAAQRSSENNPNSINNAPIETISPEAPNIVLAPSNYTANGSTILNTTPFVSNYMNQPPLIPTPIVPNSALSRPEMSKPISASRQIVDPVSVHQPSTGTSAVQGSSMPNVHRTFQPDLTSVHQQSHPRQVAPPTVRQSYQIPVHQQSTTLSSNVPPTVFQPNNVSASGQQWNVPVSAHQQQLNIPISYHQQPIVVNSMQPPPLVSQQQRQYDSVVTPQIETGSQQMFLPNSMNHQFTSNSYQQQSVPVSIYQQPIVSTMTGQQQFIPSYIQQSAFGSNPTPTTSRSFSSNFGLQNSGQNISGLGPPLPIPTNHCQWSIYDPQLNSQQLPPTRLQLAARQTMPKDYPKFNGDPERWSIFLNAYVNCTITCGLSNGENLSRLEKCLEDPARKAVQNLLTRPEAVPDIIETLKILYGRPEASIEAQLKVIRSEAPPKMNKMETFIDFAMSVRNVTSEIQKTGMWQYLWNPQITQEIVDKLPYQMRMEWGQIKITTPNVNLSNLSEWLFLRARTACAVTLPYTEKKNSKSNSDNHVNIHSKSNNSNKKLSNDISKHSTNSNEKSCRACNKTSHNTVECRKFLGMSLNERWETVKSSKICRICLGNHHVLRCESKLPCGESGCTVKHHRLLHNASKPTSVTTNENSSSSNVHNSNTPNPTVTIRRYIPVTLYGPNATLNVIAFLDEGSDTTLIESWIAKKLGVSGDYEDLYLKWTAKIVRKEPNSQSISIKISGTRTEDRQYEIKGARTVKSLNLPSQTVDISQLRKDYKFLRRIPIESYFDESPKILIGLRDCKLSTPLQTRSAGWDEPIATKTRLGWEIHGADAQSARIANLNFHSINDDIADDTRLHQMVAQFFSLENFGVKKPEQTVEALSDKRARHLLESTTRYTNMRYETGLLWRYDDISLPNSFPMAQRRLESLEKRLEKEPDLALLFRAKFDEYVEKGYVHKLSATERAETSKRTWYLPLFPVTYPKKPGKVRLVWDAAAKVSNVSLNTMLLSGPDLLVSLPGVLYRFRQRRFVVTGDIREMFHQITVRQEDQTAQRFLWREKDSSEIEVYVLQVLSFGATCSPSTAQHIKNCNALRFIEQYPEAEKAIRTNTYVDDWLQSFDTEAETESVANEVKYVHSQGGFEIRNWLSNSPRVSRSLGVSSDDEQKLSLDPEESQQERILGMWWNVKQDTFTYSLRYNPTNKDILFKARRPTKREVLRTLMTIYDPLGFLAHFLVQLKMILQDIWRTGIGWDEQIKEKDDDNLYIRWLEWIKHLPNIERISINRHYSDKINASNRTNIELHVFVDAGELAYSTVAYFRIEDQDGVECSLIGGKTKVAPLKPLSIPRMELQAAVLGARFKNSIIENHTLKITRTIIWSDSSTVLSWLRSDLRRYTQYVGARVNEIMETTELPEWRWIPSNLNPADDATKWKHSFDLDINSRWFKGPEFLLQAEEYWPRTQTKINDTTEELRPKYVNAHIQADVEPLPIKFEHFRQWIHTMALVFRFINNSKAMLQKPGFNGRYGQLQREELCAGENALYRKAQLDEFSQEIHELQEGKVDSNGRRRTVKRTSSIYRYSPYLDHANVLRMRGRIDAATNISIDQKQPIILPTQHRITELVVKEYHIRYKHQHTETVINEIKQKFMIPRLRALFKRIRRNCQHCKNASVQPKAPEMAPLPYARLASFTRPYTFVGVDYAGPYTIILNRRTVKRWIVVFTCLTIRAVYIDVVESLNTDSCIMAIRRFIARNGTPREFFSDCGTNFVGTDNELVREIKGINHDLLSTTFTSCYTQWNFNPPHGQHMGGAWERLICSMKKMLDKILPKSHYPNHETLVTALAEVENIINSRPLTFVSIEPDDQEALTPNHFLKGSSNGNKPPGIFPPLPKTLRGNWRYAQQIANEFWHKWVKEYLPMITRRTKWFDDVKPIEVGDQVIIVDNEAPRNTWDRGVVIEAVATGQDGRVSRVKVRTTNGIYTRPVTKLAVLDLAGKEAKPLTCETLAGGSVTASNDEQMAADISPQAQL